jgi:hypothetical protein
MSAGLEINGELPDFLKTPRSRMSEPVHRPREQQVDSMLA